MSSVFITMQFFNNKKYPQQATDVFLHSGGVRLILVIAVISNIMFLFKVNFIGFFKPYDWISSKSLLRNLKKKQRQFALIRLRSRTRQYLL